MERIIAFFLIVFLSLMQSGSPRRERAAVNAREFMNTGGNNVVQAASFGIVCDGATDATPGFEALNSFLVQHDNTTVVFPPNSTCLTHWGGWLWHVINVRLIFNNSALINTAETVDSPYTISAGGQDFVCQDFNGSNMTVNYYSYDAAAINAASAGASIVKVNVPASIAGWQAGDDVLIYGFDQQGSGFPPNYRYFDRTTIASVNAAQGSVSLATPLKHSYNPLWPYSAAANTTPPSIRNLTRGCANGGGIYPMQHLYVEGADFSRSPASLAGKAHTSFLLNDVRFAEFDRCKFLQLVPSLTGTLKVTNSVIGDMEIDKLVDKVIIENSQIIGDAFATTVIQQATGANEVELDHDEVWGQIVMSPKRAILRDLRIHYLNQYGFIGTGAGWYTQDLTIENPVFLADGAKPAALLNKNTAPSVTVQSVLANGAFTLNQTDAESFVFRAGAGTPLLDHTTQTLLGYVTDIYLNNGIITVAGTFNQSLKPGQSIDFNINSLNVTVRHPRMEGSDIHAWAPVFTGVWSSTIPNLRFDYDQTTTVANLGPCSYPSTGVTKQVNDAASPVFMAPVVGGGSTTVRVSCQGVNVTGSWLVR